MSKKSILYVIITALCFGTMEVALKIGGAMFTALQMNFLRFFFGGLILLPFALKEKKRRKLRFNLSDWLYMTLLGIVGISFSMSFFQMGVLNMNAHIAAVIISCNPVFTMIFAHFLVNERLTKKKILVLIICVIGLVIEADPRHMTDGNTTKGLIYMLISLVSFALYSAMGKLKAARLGGTIQTAIPFLIASVINLFVLIILKEPIFGGITLSTCPVLIYISLIVTGLGYYTFLSVIEMAGPGYASCAFFIKPIVAVVAAAIVLHEAITFNCILGIAIILSGFYLNARK